MKRSVWLILGLIVVIALVFAGLAPLPGQKDEPTPYVEPKPPGQGPDPAPPSGAPHSKPGEQQTPKQ